MRRARQMMSKVPQFQMARMHWLRVIWSCPTPTAKFYLRRTLEDHLRNKEWCKSQTRHFVDRLTKFSNNNDQSKILT